jgi:hypothetical protein
MGESSDLYLTEERIRALVRDHDHFMKLARSRAGRQMLSAPVHLPDVMKGETVINLVGDQLDAVVGPGVGQHVADTTRLLTLLDILAKGTIEEIMADWDRRVSRIDMDRLSPDLREDIKWKREVKVAQLNAIPSSEVAAVMACLDDIQKIYPGQAKDVRIRHLAVSREQLGEIARAVRTGEPSRPQLTEARIRRILDVVDSVVPGPSRLLHSLTESPLMLYGRTAAEVFPATTVRKIRSLEAGQEIFARDFVWLRFIASWLRNNDSIDECIIGQVPLVHGELWLSVARMADPRERAERFAAMFTRPIDLLVLVGRDEEAAVKSLFREIEARLHAAKQFQRASRRKEP